MPTDSTLLDTLARLTAITNNTRLPFARKLDAILAEIAACMRVTKASIMLRAGRSSLKVVASTNPDIIGVTQPLADNTPSAWVVRHKKPLYADSASPCDAAIRRFSHYQGAAFYLVPIINSGKVIGVLSVTDRIGDDRFQQPERELLLQIAGQVITTIEQNRLAESLAQSHTILRRKNADLRHLEKLRTELFNMLIHDLKEPLSEIVANLDILSYTVGGEEAACVETAKTACDTLQSMIANLLDIARLEEGRLQLLYESLDPTGLIKEALARLLVSVKAKQLAFEEQYPASALSPVDGDRTLLVRVLQNLLSNAIRYAPPGSVITIGCRRADGLDGVEFFVQDAGPGVPDQYRDKIFEKYTRLETRTDSRAYSTGLGLAFCKMAVTAHGGTIGVHSNGVSGSTFFFTIPRRTSQRRGMRQALQKITV